MTADRPLALERFYDLLGDLERRCGGKKVLADCSGRMPWPERGVYFFFEPGEMREDDRAPRVVRVGTHALQPSRSTLWKRLSQHRGNTGGRHAGGGNHRGSIFRLHVGTALLARGDWPDEVRASWGRGSNATSEMRGAEVELERAVSRYIGAMPFVWLEVDDPPSAASDRGVIEVGSIALLSNAGKVPIDPPSSDWLGHAADRVAIRESGLWNVNHIGERYDERFLDVFERNLRTI